MNVFIDTNVLLDVLTHREPFYADSARVWTLAEMSRVTGFVSTLSLPNVFYLLRRMKGHKPARLALSVMRDIFSLVPFDVQITNQSIDADIRDFEDAVQFFSALRVDAVSLVTRNTRDYPTGHIAVQTPAEFLATYFVE